MTSAYEQLERRFHRIGLLADANAILSWDSATQMPSGSADGRADQSAAIDLTILDLLNAPEVVDQLAAAQEDAALDGWRRANVREMRRLYRHATAVPADLTEAAARADLACEIAWRSARPANDFAGLSPKLNEVLRLVREIGAAKAAALGLSVYDALLDRHEPGATAVEIDRLFGEIEGFLPELIGRIIDRQAALPNPLPFAGPFPVDRQRALAVALMARFGFDFDRGRLDVSAHPFCGGASDDIRITTRYGEGDFMRSLMGVLHETGHALYEAGRPAPWRTQPVGAARGMALHESQSLIIEMQVCRSPAFLAFLAPLARDAFGGAGPQWTAENFIRANTQVRRSLIRVDADEATYPAHVILRYRLERALIAGDLALRDLPGAWADGMRDLLGVTPPDDRDGCLQDIHWPSGTFGYFPTYSLGAMIAAQLFAAADRGDPAISPAIARGDIAPLLGWLRTNVHHKASSETTGEIVIAATGRPLESAVFRAHLERRYLA